MSATQDVEPKRTVLCEDAVAWLQEQKVLAGCSFVTSLPDFSEFPQFSLQQWKTWFTEAASLILSRCPEDGVAIFYQSDIKHKGVWIDKAYLCQKAAEEQGHSLLWHKMVCRAPVGEVTWGKPGFSHLLCFSKNLKNEIAQSTADILPQAGGVTWSRGMGIEACRLAARFVLEHTTTRKIVDPFCGHGTVLLAANEVGLDALGIDIFPKRAKRARTLQLRDLDSTTEG
jgi:hypothetical protein